MPNYPWLETNLTDLAALPRKIEVQQKLGVPMKGGTPDEIKAAALAQAGEIVADLKNARIEAKAESEIVALISYLQKLGKSEIIAPAAPASGEHKTAAK
jgi:cytochrome c oxidase cbb3-type subunit I/II